MYKINLRYCSFIEMANLWSKFIQILIIREDLWNDLLLAAKWHK